MEGTHRSCPAATAGKAIRHNVLAESENQDKDAGPSAADHRNRRDSARPPGEGEVTGGWEGSWVHRSCMRVLLPG